ncbi:ExbD/TolR family protein [Xanthomonas axonopodis pv. poinsettiicola]|uniref:ExbD/TolR family protein n=1 Tax=Xanthomonas TaxID=338 RepID=UPI001E4E0192|nr:biopolymer transporter ExbD [Xanthomonas codiaei]MCC8539484.1 biopolymer transporter ExbD [Xanthomonas codiaei]
MKVQGRKPYDDINITPMLDLAYVLLVIFIIMTTAAVQGIKVDLPKASAAKPLSEPKTKVIAIDTNGQISLDAVPVSMDELEQQLRNAVANDAELPVILRGDRSVQYEKIMAVLDLCSKLGIGSIGLASQRQAAG